MAVVQLAKHTEQMQNVFCVILAVLDPLEVHPAEGKKTEILLKQKKGFKARQMSVRLLSYTHDIHSSTWENSIKGADLHYLFTRVNS